MSWQICSVCFYCKQEPLDSESRKKGYQPNIHCAKGRFNSIEPRNIPIKWSKNNLCPDFPEDDIDIIGDKIIINRRHRKNRIINSVNSVSGYVNLGDILPEELLKEIQKYVKYPCMVYVPADKNDNKAEREKVILDDLVKTRSIRGTAKNLHVSRNTVREIIKEKCKDIIPKSFVGYDDKDIKKITATAKNKLIENLKT